MKYILNENNHEPAMRYEGLACYAFSCERGGGPDEIANASYFDSEFIEILTENGLKAIYSIIDALIRNEDDNNKISALKTARDSLTVGMKQENSIELLDYIIKILKE